VRDALINSVLLGLANMLGFWQMAHALEKFRDTQTVTILNYHCVGPSQFLKSLPVSSFQSQLDYLIRNCTVISFRQALDFFLGRADVPPNTVVLTFDDGTRDSYVHVFPLLKRYNLPSTVFLPTLSIGTGRMLWVHKRKYLERRYGSDAFWREVYKRLPAGAVTEDHNGRSRKEALYPRLEKRIREALMEDIWQSLCRDVDEPGLAHELYLSWDNVREMSRAGIEFGSHSVSHPVLSGESAETIMDEVCHSREQIAREVGAPCDLFAYPFGSFNERVCDSVRQAGYVSAVSTIDGRNSRPTELFILRRIRVVNEPLQAFAYRVSPVRFWLKRFREGGGEMCFQDKAEF
jgi:peptidoglycan/xylan/chitin deacetylase (PgdA/CDA1 family)